MRLARPTVTGLVAALTLALAVPAASHAGYGRLSTVSVRADGGGTGGGASQRPSGSGDGHFLAFESSATNLVAGATDTNADFDVFLRDRAGGTTALVSHAYGMPSVAADAISSSPLVSGDSRWVAYVSQADDLVAGQSPGTGDDHVFLYDRDTGANVLVDHSTSSETQAGDAPVLQVWAVSTDGQYVVYTSSATNVAAGDGNGGQDVFVYDRTTKLNKLVSHKDGVPGQASNGTDTAAVSASADASEISFTSNATDIVGTATIDNVYLWRRAGDSLELVSHKHGDPLTEASPASLGVAMSSDGAYVLWEGDGPDVIDGTDVPSGSESGDLFLYSVASGTNELVSHVAGDPSTAANGTPVEGSLSADGRYAAWLSHASGVAGPNPMGRELVYLFDRTTGDNTLVSAPSNDSTTPRVSPDGATVAYESQAGNGDVIAWDRASGVNRLVSHAAPDVGGNAPSTAPSFAGPLLVFQSNASSLAGDVPEANAATDVFAASNAAPGASFTATPAGGSAPLDVVFAALASDADGQIASYAWRYGDGATGSGQSPSHRYAAAGTYTATLTVSDDSGTQATATRQINVTVPGGRGGQPPSLGQLVSALLKKAAKPCHVRKRTDYALVVCGGNKLAKPDLRVYVVNARAGSLKVTVAAVEGGARYPKKTLTVPAHGSKSAALKAPRKLRAALKRSLRRHKSVARRLAVTLTGSGLAKTRLTHKVTLHRAPGG